jgi:hypothetical protein
VPMVAMAELKMEMAALVARERLVELRAMLA